MFVEYLREDKISLPIRGSGKLRNWFPALYRICSRRFRSYLLGQCSAVMFSYYGDKPRISELKRHCPIIRYVPWCTETDDTRGEEKRDRRAGIYIGSLEGFKNAAELVEAIPLILDRSETETFTVVGPGEYASKIKKMSAYYGSRLVYIESVSRPEAMKLLRASGFGYTPVSDCGLGFIGDCWGTGTPLIATHELDGFLQKDVDTLVVDDIHGLPSTINSLINNDDLFEKMSRNGHDRYFNNFSAKSVGNKYLNVLEEVLKYRQR
jgi:glycosyltransferase involved in cell wall biosynthesis